MSGHRAHPLSGAHPQVTSPRCWDSPRAVAGWPGDLLYLSTVWRAACKPFLKRVTPRRVGYAALPTALFTLVSQAAGAAGDMEVVRALQRHEGRAADLPGGLRELALLNAPLGTGVTAAQRYEAH